MRRSIRTLITALVVVLAASGCGVGSSYSGHAAGPPAAYQCNVNPDPAGSGKSGLTVGGNQVVGAITFDCGSTITSHNVHLQLQFDPGDGNNLTNVAEPDALAESKSPSQQLGPRLQVTANCRAGYWKLYATAHIEVTGAAPGGASEVVPTSVLRLTENDCGRPVPGTTKVTSLPPPSRPKTSVNPPANRRDDPCDPHLSDLKVGATIEGTVAVACAAQPKQYEGTLQLQYSTSVSPNDPGGMKWAVVDQASVYSPNGSPQKVTSKCKVGSWLLVYLSHGRDAQGRDFDSVLNWPVPAQRVLSCP